MIICFWCNKPLTKEEKTRDHLFSKFIRKKFKTEASSTCCACYQCNQERGRISFAFEFIYRNGQIPNKKIRKLLKNIDVFKFKKKIEENLTENIKIFCLLEINEILKYNEKYNSYWWNI